MAVNAGTSTTCCTLSGLEAANVVPTPSLAAGRPDGEQHRLYRSYVGSLLYISHDRPEIMWDIGLLSGRLSAPYNVDMKRLVRVARYLKGEPNLGVWLPQNKKDQGTLSVSLRLWSDANWAAPDSQRKSVGSLAASSRRTVACCIRTADGSPSSPSAAPRASSTP